MHHTGARWMTWTMLCGWLYALPAMLPGVAQAGPAYQVGAPLVTQAGFERIAARPGPRKVVYLPPATEYNFYLELGGALQQSLQAAGHEYQLRSPQRGRDYLTQVRMLEDAVRSGADAIVISTLTPQAEQAAAPLLAAAARQGAAIVVVNTDQRSFPFPVHAVIGVQQRAATRALGRHAAGQGTRPETAAVITGEPGQFSTERTGGFAEGIGTRLKVVEQANGHWSAPGGYQAALALLSRHPDVKVVFAANDFEIIGAAAAAAALGRNDVQLYGYDGVPDALMMVAQGRLAATVRTDAAHLGAVTAQVLLDVFAGRFAGGFVDNPAVIVDRANAARLLDDESRQALSLDVTGATIVAEALPGLSNADGSGLYWDILRRVFEPAGVALQLRTTPLQRAKSMAALRSADAMLGHDRADDTRLILPQWHYDERRISVAFVRGARPWRGVESLQGKRVAWMAGSGYERYLTVPVIGQPKNNRSATLRMLSLGRVDFVIDEDSELRQALKDMPDAGIQVEDLFALKLYPAFAGTPKGRRLAAIFDQRMPQLLYSGELHELYRKWGYAPPGAHR